MPKYGLGMVTSMAKIRPTNPESGEFEDPESAARYIFKRHPEAVAVIVAEIDQSIDLIHIGDV